MTRGMWIAAAAAAVLVALGAATITLLATRPRPDRDWIPEQAVLPHAVIDGDIVRITNVRNFRYTARREFTPAYEDREYDLRQLTSVWYVLTPFSLRWRGPAHSFVSFGFADGRYLAISVEARRERGEEYSALRGLFRRYELMYVIGDERDLIGQRAAFDDDRVYLYPVRTSPEKMRAMLVGMLERANTLRERPEFYNTFRNSCTSNVVAHVNLIAPRTVPAGIKVLLPGYTDEVAHRLGLLDTDLDIESARHRYLINARARRYITAPDFSARIRAAGPDL